MGIIDKFKGWFGKKEMESAIDSINMEKAKQDISDAASRLIEAFGTLSKSMEYQMNNKDICEHGNEIERLTKIMSNTKNKRIKKKLLKRIEILKESGF
ncbi:hypothetical protein [Paenibacillus sp. NAIST15-1]|uniref:hypothetical protein n=1 Tax=Paenibacillus sp. NAIST15-1 TaxID=1605994 RepID=UPI00086A1682|nr:hypothetical protein [Paenibacillus sp. NAIST15-1]GAV11402.1 hypothetical protein PBN151_1331 [Paenibacillus sp. NAIST15-1]